MASTENRSTSDCSQPHEKRHRSIFDLPFDFLESCRLLPPHSSPLSGTFSSAAAAAAVDATGEEHDDGSKARALQRWSCNICKAEFDSLMDQRSHFKSDIHRFNVKLSIAGKNIVKEEDFDESNVDSLFKDDDISSISGSEDEAEKGLCNDNHRRPEESFKKKLFIRLQNGEIISVWKCLFFNETEKFSYDIDKSAIMDSDVPRTCLTESDVIERLKCLIQEPRDNTSLRVVLLASGGHFAGCVFDGSSVVAHKTFHRYVVRAKAGKKQSSKDATGRAANSAGASLRRHNELALKKEVQEILAVWKPYFDASSCVFIHAPSSNRQLLFNGDKPYFSSQHSVIRTVPLTVRRPTFKEAQKIYTQLIQVTCEIDEKELKPSSREDSALNSSIVSNSISETNEVKSVENLENCGTIEVSSSYKKSDGLSVSSEGETEVIGKSTPLHDAAKFGGTQEVLKLLEQGFDPCVKNERGRTPYMLATDKEVRNTFRRFMAANLDKWDWHAAKVPSALTKEMEESQTVKQAEKDAKKKARSKELKKLRKAREKKAQAQAALPQNAGSPLDNRGVAALSVPKGLSQPSGGVQISKEDELKRAQAAEREKRAAAAERRIAAAAALNAQGSIRTTAPSSSQPKSGTGTDIYCSCCNVSLAGKVPFHRYNYKYCSTTCMHVHSEFLEDG